jgi:hypothetical protein
VNEVGDPFRKILLLGIAAHVGERQHGDRRFLLRRLRGGSRGSRNITWLGGVRAEQDAMGAHRPGDVLDLLLAHVLEREIELVSHLIAHDAAGTDATRLRQGFEAGRDVDPVAIDVGAVDDDVADVQPDAKFDAAFRRYSDVAIGHLALDIDGAAHRVDDTGELDEDAVAGGS